MAQAITTMGRFVRRSKGHTAGILPAHSDGRHYIIYDVSGAEKKSLQVSDLLAKFQIASGGEFANDRMMLS